MVKYPKGELKFYLKGSSSQKWLEELSTSKEPAVMKNYDDLKKLAKYKGKNQKWTEQDRKSAEYIFKKAQKIRNKSRKRKRKGIRNIKIKGKSIRFERGAQFHNTKRDAKKSQEIFQDRGHLTRVISARGKRKIKGIRTTKKYKGYYMWFSEKRIRERRRIK